MLRSLNSSIHIPQFYLRHLTQHININRSEALQRRDSLTSVKLEKAGSPSPCGRPVWCRGALAACFACRTVGADQRGLHLICTSHWITAISPLGRVNLISLRTQSVFPSLSKHHLLATAQKLGAMSVEMCRRNFVCQRPRQWQREGQMLHYLQHLDNRAGTLSCLQCPPEGRELRLAIEKLQLLFWNHNHV